MGAGSAVARGGAAALQTDADAAYVKKAWAKLETPDRTGFCGLTCAAPIMASRDPQEFTEDGYARRNTKAGKVVYEPVGGDIIGFEALPSPSVMSSPDAELPASAVMGLLLQICLKLSQHSSTFLNQSNAVG